MKTIFTTPTAVVLLACLLLMSPSATAQRLSRLMQERDQLYQDWEYYKSQNNAFFGGKSKEDLSNIIEVQQQIITKDNDILEEVRTVHVNTQKGIQKELEATQDQLSTAKAKIGELESKAAATAELYNDCLSDIANQSGYKNSAFIFILLLLGSTTFLAFRLRKALTQQSAFTGTLSSPEDASEIDGYITRLEKINRLKDQGLITEEEYKAQKDKILSAL